MPASTTLPLRERKRIETWKTLHEAASSLAMQREHLNCVTVEEIVDLAHVSARTFFNYFGTKEDAILGFSEPAISEQALESFTDSDDPLVSRVANFYFDVMTNSRTGGAGRTRRIKAIARHPELANRQITHFGQVELVLREAVLEHLPEQELPASVSSTEELVDVLVAASSTAYRIATHRFTSGSTDGDDREAMHHVLTQLREVSELI